MLEFDWLRKWSRYSPKNIAIQDDETSAAYTYRQCYLLSNRIASYLKHSFDIKRGDRVAVLSENNIEYVFLLFALQRLGAILVPINFRLAPAEIANLLTTTQPKLIAHHESYLPILENELKGQIPQTPLLNFVELNILIHSDRECKEFIAMDPAPEDTCMILYTSGTTGQPKGVIITYKMLFWNSINTALRLDLRQDDKYLGFLPFFHTAGWNVLFFPLLHKGGTTHFINRFDAERILTLTEQEKLTILFGVPTTLRMMAEKSLFEQSSLESLRFLIVGGEAMPIDLIEQWHQKGVPVRQGYGLTEFGPNVFSLNAEDAIAKKGSIGFPNFYIEADMKDDEGNTIPGEGQGELVLRGPVCTPGYFNNPQATEELIQDGWLHTGDMVRRDKEGFYYVIGRKKDMFISGGENVYPPEIETVIRTHEKVREVAVVGVKDPKWGEVGKAFIVSKEDCNADDILSFCCQKLAKYKVPKHIAFIEQLPKSDSGKILKRQLMDNSSSIGG